MAGDLDLAPYAAHHAFLVDEKGGALDPHVFPPVHALLDPDAVALAHLALDVGGESEGQLVLLLELVVRGDGVLRDPDYGGLDLTEFREGVAKAAGLRGAAGGVILGIKIQHYFLAAQLGQGDLAVAVGRQGEIRRLVADLDTRRACSSGEGGGGSRIRAAAAGASTSTS